MKFYKKSLIYKNTTLYDIDFPQKIGILRFFLRKFLLTVLHIFHRKYTPNFQKIDFSIYPNILYIYDQNFILVPTIKLFEFSDKNWETYDRLLIFWSIFWSIFFYCPKFQKWNFIKNPWYTIIQHCTTLIFLKKLEFCDFFLRKFSIDGFFTLFMENIINFYCPKFQKWNFIKNPWYTKIQHCTTLIFLKKLEFCDFFKKVSIDGFTHFSSKIHPKFSKIDFSIYPNILYIYDQNFMLVPTIKLLEFSDKNWETYERLLIFWSIFWLFFLLSKVSKMKFYKKSLIYKNTTLYDIDFPQKIGILRFFLRKFLMTVFHIIYGKYY